MILEAFQYVTTQPKVAAAKEMGYLKESIAMVARAKRCKQHWGEHYQNCQNTILQSFGKLSQYRKVVIFGAGTLQDLPLDALSKQFEKVVLVDLVFLKPAYKLAQNYDNIELVEHDVTESLNWLKDGFEVVQKPSKWLDDEELDLVISLNLITQLPLIPVRWLMKQYGFSETQADALGKQLIFAHMNYLKQFKARVCLIADREDREFDQHDIELDCFDPWWGVQSPQAEHTWSWQVVPLGEGKPNRKQQNTVGVSYL